MLSKKWPKFGQKGPFLNFPKKYENFIFFRLPKTRLSTKNYKILMNGLRKKCEKPTFLGILFQNANFGQFLAKMGETGFFFKKALGTFLSRLQALTTNFQKKVMNGFRETAWHPDEQMNERTWFLSSKYRFKQPKCIVLRTPKKPEKGQELTYPQQGLTFMFKSIEI